MTKIDLAKKFKENGYVCSMDMDCKKCKEITGFNCLQADVKLWCDEILSSSDFEEWKAINSAQIEELADYFMAHDIEKYFTGDKYKEAYKKIESLCELAYYNRR